MHLPGRAAGVVLGAAAITAAVAVVAWLVFQRAFYDRVARTEHIPPPQIGERRELAVVSVAGSVERTASGGGWRRVAAGERLGREDAIRTGANSRADLAVDQRSRLTVTEGSQLAIREVVGLVHRFQVSRGRVAFEYAEEGARRVQVEDGSGNRVAEARSARFSVLATGTSLAVATETGSVTLRAAGGAVDVNAGQQAVAQGDSRPSVPSVIPVRLLLEVADAAGGGDFCARVEGRAERGAEVTVDGRAVEIGEDGRFALRVARRSGRTHVRVHTRDASGRTADRIVPCREPDRELRHFSVRWKNASGS